MKVIVQPRQKTGTFNPEQLLILAMWICPLMPISLFLFGFGASLHWMVPIISQVFCSLQGHLIFSNVDADIWLIIILDS
jgi:DHA1 family multidrug resistance protein-like MFS transporter